MSVTARLRQVGRLVGFVLWYLGEWLRTNLEVTVEIVTPGTRISAAFLEVPLRCRTDLEITLIANLISLTPGTVTVSTRREPATIWVHCLFADDVPTTRAGLHDMEGRMLRALRVDPDLGPVPPPPGPQADDGASGSVRDAGSGGGR